MQRTNIYLDAEQLRALKHLAAEDRCSVAELIRRSVDSYIATRLADETEWREPLDAFLARLRARLPAGIPPEEVEADVTLAHEEARLNGHAPSGR